MSAEMFELEVIGRDHAIRYSRIADSVDAFRHYLTRTNNVRDNKFRIQRLGVHHFVLTMDSERLAEHLRDTLITVYRVHYCGAQRSVRERQYDLTR